MDKLKIGDVVALKSDIHKKMTAEYVSEKNDSDGGGEVVCAYWNNGEIIHVRNLCDAMLARISV